jgi:hypothetical protein
MEPFAVHCTTCKARLRVQDESAIGQILSCPKCHSMVLIERPAEPVSSSSSTSSVTISAAVASVLSAAAPPSPAPSVLATPPPLPVRLPESVPVPSLADAPLVKHSPRDWWLFSGGIGMGVAVGTLIWMLIVPGADSKPPVTPTVVSTAEVEGPAVKVSEPEPTKIEVPPLATPVAKEEEPAPDLGRLPTTPLTEDPNETLTAAEPEQPQDEVAAVSDQAETPAEAAPEQLTAELPATPSSLPTDKLALKSAGPSDEEVSQKLGQRVTKVEFQKTPLPQFLSFVAELSGVKFKTDIEPRFAPGKAPTITVRVKDATIDELLHTALSKAGLHHEIREGTVVIVAGPGRATN